MMTVSHRTPMKPVPYRRYFVSGIAFLRDHPQVWFTALVGCVIVSAFIFVAFRFASIAHDAQEELVEVRIGSMLDSLVLFAPDVLPQPDVLRTRLAQLKEYNTTVDYFMIIAPHGEGDWRIYVRDDGVREGTVFSPEDPGVRYLYASAQGDPDNAYTLETSVDGERYYLTARAIQDPVGTVAALAVSGQRISEVDRLIAANIKRSMIVLVVVLILIMALFIRHARIIDYASLYKKQLEVDEMKDNFISMASHELKSPLTVIRGYIEFLREGVPEEEKRVEYLRRIDVSASELRQLVDDILDVSRIEMGRLRFSPDYIQPYEVITEVCDMFVDSARTKDITLSLNVDAAAQGVTVRVDRGRFKQVMVNLVSNAIKYTLAGTVTIEQTHTPGRLEVSVRDTGVGMTSEEQAKLFGKFYRVEAQETKHVSGTGLGLWITRYIVEHMDGTISVESIKGEGSRFVVSFPDHSTESEHNPRPVG